MMPNSTETAWQEISTAALLGTQRKPFQAPSLPGELGEVLKTNAGRHSGNSAAILLRTAAVSVLHRRAGKLPPASALPYIIPCPLDERPQCSSQAGYCLEMILNSGRAPVLAEWIELANRRGMRLREEHLESLLNQQKMIFPLRAAILPVLGERGRWLAAQNPEWDTFVYYTEERIWHEGQRKERMAYLNDLRTRDPQAARELLTSTWAEESPNERTIFLRVLANGLSMADEPFLETVLDDRRKDVRQTAGELLAHLPGSRLVQRMIQMGQQLLSWKNGLLRGSIEANLPESCGERMLRDGVEQKPSSGLALGEKAWWLAQVLALIPPSTWSSRWNKKVSTLIEAVSKNEMEDALIYGWTEAALRFADSEWIEALLVYERRRADSKRLYDLFVRLPQSAKEAVMIDLLRENHSLAFDNTPSIWLS
ncbi:MAG: hypothetical protein IH586_04660, partial [Anaerolineaceae bacterium]|nr:hypothetical protein [Anaerolineaceae bacterium]